LNAMLRVRRAGSLAGIVRPSSLDCMLGDHLDKRRVKKIFGKLVEPGVVDEVLGCKSPTPSLAESFIEFVLVSVRFNTPEQVSNSIGRVIEICTEHEAFIDGVSGSVVVAAFAVQPHGARNTGAAVELVADLIRGLGPDVKIVHGSGSGYYG